MTEKLFCDLTEEDWQGHEKFSSEEEMHETYGRYYKQPVDQDTIVKIINFDLIPV